QNARLVGLQVTPGATTEVKANWPTNLSRIDLNFIVTVPNGVNVQLKTASGTIHVANIEGKVTTESASGSISISGVMGSVDLRSASGSIRAQQIAGDLTAAAASGSIRASDVTGKTTATSVSGAVDIVNPGNVVVGSTVSGRLQVTANKVAGDYQLHATSGPVMVTLPSDASVTVKAKSISGTVARLPWLTLGEGRNSASGTQGDGTYKITVDTASGAITIGSR
ncbi:MAG: DUF4097 family beta strand repeat-containing protein, partial [Mycobacterium leprae]